MMSLALHVFEGTIYLALLLLPVKFVDMVFGAYQHKQGRKRDLLIFAEKAVAESKGIKQLWWLYFVKIYRWPVLILCQTYFTIRIQDKEFQQYSGFVLFAGIWLMVIHIFYQLWTGSYKHSHFLETARPILVDNKDIHRRTRRQEVQEFVQILSGLVFTVIVGYTGIYLSLINTQGDNSFKGMEIGNLHTWAKMAYFSLVTTATVGYGDISPMSTMAHFLVASQIGLGMIVLVLLVNVCSLTVGEETN